MQIKGIMIDCSRTMEQHAYYFRLIDVMSEWGLNTLVLHFADDHGLGIKLPGFGSVAMPHAFTTREIRKLVQHADARGIDVIPEVEVFGHTRFLTDHPDYEHLFLGRKTKRLLFCAVDPFNDETYRVMRRLIRATADLFPSTWLHLGCDEVDLAGEAQKRGLNEAEVWTDYVNHMIGVAKEAGKQPMIWGDHPAHDPAIARLLRKDVVLIDWRYRWDVRDTVLRRYRAAGFEQVMTAPSMACYRHRFLPTREALQNTRRMIRYAVRHDALGSINTVWCPYRYLQNAMYYGVAYTGHVMQNGGRSELAAFHRRLARVMFGTRLVKPLAAFLSGWTRMMIVHTVAEKLLERAPAYSEDELQQIRTTYELGPDLLQAAASYEPAKNEDIWQSMLLAARGARVLAEHALIQAGALKGTGVVREHKQTLKDITRELAAEWDRTRFADGICKWKPQFGGSPNAHVLPLLRRLSRGG